MNGNYTVVKEFPLPTIQNGAPLGNSFLGVLVWGSGRKLNISLGSHTLWDHRGGLPWNSKMSYSAIKKALYENDEEGLNKIFAFPDMPPGTPKRPQIVPLGRVEVSLPEESELLRYELELHKGKVTVFASSARGEEKIEFLLGRSNKNVLLFRSSLVSEITLKDSWHLSGGLLAETGIEEPEFFSGSDVEYFRQPLPQDPSFGLGVRKDGALVTVSFARGDEAVESLSTLQPGNWDALEAENKIWWNNYFSSVTSIEMDNPVLTELYHFGLYKFGSMSDPDGVPAGLQGPWIEDNRFPPWSGDYHFNINVEMCYSPALRAGLFQNLRHLFKMVYSWREKLQNNARLFAGVEEGFLMPHAVDDRGTFMGGFWTGAIDHACSAWTAQMMFDYCDYSGDMVFLEEFVFDFMKGVLKVYTAMMEEDGKGKLCLPVTVSPEYRGKRFDAWGVNASFQLAAVHRLVRNLMKVAELLGEEPDPIWADIEQRLPEVTVAPGNISEALDKDTPEIALWEGQALEYSHRHHSHLAGICPFNTIDPESPCFKELVKQSRQRWIVYGMGGWSGWSIVWAAQLNSHFKQSDNGELLLEIFNRVFTNKGGGTLHNGYNPGFTLLGDSGGRELMQIDGAMGAVAAIQEMMLYDCCGVLHIGDGVPEHWKHGSFTEMPAPGGFRISASFQKGKGVSLAVRGTRRGVCRIFLDPVRCWPQPQKGRVKDNIWEIALEAGETVTL